jgi:hypothetical protein
LILERIIAKRTNPKGHSENSENPYQQIQILTGTKKDRYGSDFYKEQSQTIVEHTRTLTLPRRPWSHSTQVSSVEVPDRLNPDLFGLAISGYRIWDNFSNPTALV